jgi:hypothetical protein
METNCFKISYIYIYKKMFLQRHWIELSRPLIMREISVIFYLLT